MNQNWINQNKKPYEPPTAKIYRFGAKEQILTASGAPNPPTADPEFAANALNQLMGGVNTTYEG